MIKQDKLRFGTAGIPLSTPDRNIQNGVNHVRTLGLDCMELEFVRAVNVSKEKAPIINELAKKKDVMLTCHGQYFINLNSKEEEKVHASIHRIFEAAKIASMCGAYSMTFHAAFYQGASSERTTEIVAQNIKKIVHELKTKVLITYGFDRKQQGKERSGEH